MAGSTVSEIEECCELRLWHVKTETTDLKNEGSDQLANYSGGRQ